MKTILEQAGICEQPVHHSFKKFSVGTRSHESHLVTVISVEPITMSTNSNSAMTYTFLLLLLLGLHKNYENKTLSKLENFVYRYVLLFYHAILAFFISTTEVKFADIFIPFKICS